MHTTNYEKNKKNALSNIAKNVVITRDSKYGRRNFELSNQNNIKSQIKDLQNKVNNTNLYEFKKLDSFKSNNNEINFNKDKGKIKFIKDLKSDKEKYYKYCGHCQVGFNDNLEFLSHLNSALHNRVIGQEMRVKKSSYENIKDKLDNNDENAKLIKRDNYDTKNNNISEENNKDISSAQKDIIKKLGLPLSFK